MKDGNREESGEKRRRGKARRRGRRKGEKGGRREGLKRPVTESLRSGVLMDANNKGKLVQVAVASSHVGGQVRSIKYKNII